VRPSCDALRCLSSHINCAPSRGARSSLKSSLSTNSSRRLWWRRGRRCRSTIVSRWIRLSASVLKSPARSKNCAARSPKRAAQRHRPRGGARRDDEADGGNGARLPGAHRRRAYAMEQKLTRKLQSSFVKLLPSVRRPRRPSSKSRWIPWMMMMNKRHHESHHHHPCAADQGQAPERPTLPAHVAAPTHVPASSTDEHLPLQYPARGGRATFVPDPADNQIVEPMHSGGMRRMLQVVGLHIASQCDRINKHVEHILRCRGY